MKLFVKNMVCSRCKMVVKAELEKAGYEVTTVDLGEVELSAPVTQEDKKRINETLVPLGFALIDDKKMRLIEQVKTVLIDLVQNKNSLLTTNLSDLVSSSLHHEYNYISSLFTQVEGTTIEQYFITLKIERVKELLVYDELNLSEIAVLLNYSSVAHLSRQFKKATGLTPSHFKQLKENKRHPLDDL